MSEPNNVKRANRRNSLGSKRHRLQGLAGGGLGFAAVAALVMLVAPFSAAHGTVTFTAPYTGFTATASNYTYNSTCAHASNSVPINWNSSTGETQFNGAGSAGGCHGFQYGYSEGFLTVKSRTFSAPFNGAGYVYLVYTSAFTAKAALHLATTNVSNTTYRGGYASVSLSVSAYVYDATHHNGSFFGYATAYLLSQTFYSASGSLSLTQGGTTGYLFVSGTFTAGHVYVIDTSIYAFAYAESYGGGTTASASLDLGGTNGLTLSSITAY